MIEVENLCYAVGNFRLREVSLKLEAGEYFALLGPPGSGKSVFLECLCGLRRVSGGTVRIGGREVTGLEPRERAIGYVPQDYGLFPHLTAAENIGFGLRGLSRDERRRKVRKLAETLGIAPLLERSIRGLSGGEKQRTALARALATKPRVLLLDEPVSALDEATRESVCAELRRIQRRFGVTTVHVSHNLEEAFSVADRGGIIHDGAFQQVGPMSELLRAPRTEFVAGFMRCENIFTGEVAASTAPAVPAGPGRAPGTTRVRAEGMEFDLPGKHTGAVKFIIRPENLLPAPLQAEKSNPADSPAAAVAAAAAVSVPVPARAAFDSDGAGASKEQPTPWVVRPARVVDRGAYVRLETEGPLHPVVHLPHAEFRELRVAPGDELRLTVRPGAVQLLEENDEAREEDVPDSEK